MIHKCKHGTGRHWFKGVDSWDPDVRFRWYPWESAVNVLGPIAMVALIVVVLAR